MKKCFCKTDMTVYCGECGEAGLKVAGADLDDVMSALTHFIYDYKPKAPAAKKAMRRILDKAWLVVRAESKRKATKQ